MTVIVTMTLNYDHQLKTNAIRTIKHMEPFVEPCDILVRNEFMNETC